MHNTQTFLAVGHDAGNGLMRLDDDRLAIEWTNGPQQRVFQRIEEALTTAAHATGGTYMRNPVSEKVLGGNLMTVHPLGGCTMGESSATGVVNHKGQVFDASRGAAPDAVHAGLYVCDGAVIPCPLGIHPLMTITALAERAMILLARDRGWHMREDAAPVQAHAAPHRRQSCTVPRHASEISHGLRAGAGAVPRRSRESDMRRLSKSVAELKLRYDVVVVGSGYGGGVAASRMARAGKKVAVLERGQEFAIGDFPDRMIEAQEQFQVSQDGKRVSGSPTGLYDLRLGKDIHVFVGCGLGGGSLVNANVSLPPDPRVWDDPVWPPEIMQDPARQEGLHARHGGAAARARIAARRSTSSTRWASAATRCARTSCGRRST